MPPDTLRVQARPAVGVLFAALVVASLLAGVVVLSAPASADSHYEPVEDDFEDYETGVYGPGEWTEGLVEPDSYHGDRSLMVGYTANSDQPDAVHPHTLAAEDLSVEATVKAENFGGGISIGDVEFLFLASQNDARINVNGEWTTQSTSVGQNEWANLRIEGNASEYRMKLWSVDSPEPEAWDVTVAHNRATEGQVRITSMGLDNRLWVDRLTAQPLSTAGTQTVSGRVVDQQGTPAPEGTTVTAWGVREPALDASDAAAMRDEADQLLAELDDPLPASFDRDFDLDAHTDTAGTYALAHAESDWGVGTTTIVESSLEEPRVVLPSDEPALLSLWDADAGGGLVDNQVDQSFAGATTAGTVVVEQLGPTDAVLDRETYETSVVAETTGVNPLSTTEHHAARVDLPPGVYRVHPEGAPTNGYTVVVGDPSELASGMASELRDEADRLTDRAERLQSMLDGGEVARVTTTTDADGRFSLSVPSDVVSVQVRAMRADGSVLANLTDPSLSDLRDARASGYNGSVVLPSPTPTRVAPPSENVTVDVVRSPTVPYEDPGEWAALLDEWRDDRLNETLAELEGQWDQRVEDLTRERLERQFNDLVGLVDASPVVEDRYLDQSGRDAVPDAAELSTATLRTEVGHLQAALYLGGGVDVTPPETPDIGDALTGRFGVPDGVSADAVSVRVAWANGTVRTVSDEHWSLEPGGLFGGPEVVAEVPIDATDPVAGTLAVSVATDDGAGEGRVPITNPHRDGAVPAVPAVDVSTLAPGPDDRVRMTLRPDGPAFDRVVGVSAVGPDGTPVNASVTGDQRVRVATDGAGVHSVRVRYRAASGAEIVRTVRVRAGETPLSPPPTLRVAEGATGAFAVVGQDLASGGVEPNADGVTLTAVVAGDADAPSQLVVEPGTVLDGGTERVAVRVVRGADRVALQSHVGVAMHVDRLGDSARVWRGEPQWFGGEPLVVGGETAVGEIVTGGGDRAVVRTYTDASGAVTTTVERSPGPVERWRHGAAQWLPALSVPVLGGFVVWRRRA